MRHETFPAIPGNGGAFFNNPDARDRRLEALRNIPDAYFKSGYYVASFNRPFGRYQRGCELYHLATAEMTHSKGRFIRSLREDSLLSRHILTEKLEKDLNFPYEFSCLLEEAYEAAGGGKGVALHMLEAIPAGMQTLAQVPGLSHKMAVRAINAGRPEPKYLTVAKAIRTLSLQPVLVGA